MAGSAHLLLAYWLATSEKNSSHIRETLLSFNVKQLISAHRTCYCFFLVGMTCYKERAIFVQWEETKRTAREAEADET